MKPVDLVFVAIFLVGEAMLAWSVFTARDFVLADTSQTGNVKWQEWKEASIREAKEFGPVERKPVKSDVAPLTVLLGEYFVTCLIGTLAVGAVPLAITLLLLRGVFSKRSKVP